MDKQRHKLYNRYARLKSFGAYEYSVFYVLHFIRFAKEAMLKYRNPLSS